MLHTKTGSVYVYNYCCFNGIIYFVDSYGFHLALITAFLELVLIEQLQSDILYGHESCRRNYYQC